MVPCLSLLCRKRLWRQEKVNPHSWHSYVLSSRSRVPFLANLGFCLGICNDIYSIYNIVFLYIILLSLQIKPERRFSSSIAASHSSIIIVSPVCCLLCYSLVVFLVFFYIFVNLVSTLVKVVFFCRACLLR